MGRPVRILPGDTTARTRYPGLAVATKLSIRRFSVPTLVALGVAVPAGLASAEPPRVVQNPSYAPNPEPLLIDVSAPGYRVESESPPGAASFHELDDYQREVVAPADAPTEHSLPEGLTQVGGMVVPEAMLDGAEMVPDAARALAAHPDPAAGGEDWPPEFCAFPEEVPPGVYDYDHRPGGETPRYHTVFLNYNGGVLNTGGENSAENMSNIALSGHMFPVYAGGEEKAIAAAQAVQNDFEPYAVRIIYNPRPPKILPYTMVMIGGHYSDTTAGPSGGVAPLDCEDFGQRNVCYAFQNGAAAALQANVASQEIGHTLGLGHTSASDSVMAAGYASTQPGDLGFNDSCAPTIQVQGQGASCQGVNKCHCGVGDQQHDINTLFATFAPAGPDVTPPTIEVLAPADGDVFTPEDTIRVEFDPWDDVGGYGWKMVVTNVDTGEVLADQVDYERVTIFDLVGLPEGTYEDHGDQTAEDAVTIVVENPGAGSGGEDAGGSGGMEGDDDDDDESGDDGIEGMGDGGGESVEGDSCSCREGAPTTPALALSLLALLGLRRRD